MPFIPTALFFSFFLAFFFFFFSFFFFLFNNPLCHTRSKALEMSGGGWGGWIVWLFLDRMMYIGHDILM